MLLVVIRLGVPIIILVLRLGEPPDSTNKVKEPTIVTNIGGSNSTTNVGEPTIITKDIDD